MAEDFAATLFTEARAHHEAARRWFCIVTAAFAVFHVMIFAPYLDLTGRKTEAARTLAEKTQLKQKLDEMAPSLDQLRALSTAEAKARLDDLLKDLRSTFDRLNGIVDNLRRLGPEAAAGDSGQQLFLAEASSPIIANMAAQIPNVRAQTGSMPIPVALDMPSMNASLRHDIAGANSERTLLDIIRPYIEQEVIAPRFSAFNSGWQDEVTPKIDDVGGTLAQKVRATKSQFPGEAASLTSLEQGISEVVTAAKKFKIEPPADPFWWSQSASKDGTFHGFLRVLSETELSRSSAFAQLQGRIEAAISANRHQQDEIDQRVKELDKEFRTQQSELAELVGPLKGISIDLTTIVPYVPIILAVAFITLTGWLASRTQELGEAVALMARNTADGSAQEWLRGRMTASLWHRPFSVVARCVVLAAWVAFASWELAGASVVTSTEATLFALVGGIGMTLAAQYEWRVVRSLRSSVGTA